MFIYRFETPSNPQQMCSCCRMEWEVTKAAMGSNQATIGLQDSHRAATSFLRPNCLIARGVTGFCSILSFTSIMGGVCSRKRSQLVDEGDSPQTSPRFSKTSSLKWLLLSLPRSNSDVSGKGQGNEPGRCPSLMELCVARVCQVVLWLHVFEF